jgi:DNA primase
MNLLDLLRLDGIELKKAAETNGGEFCGACPFCGGNDRFRVWPEFKGGRFWCRGCNKHGDNIQYLRDAQGLSYREACERLGIDMKSIKDLHLTGQRERAGFIPKEAASPPLLWQEKATAFFQAAQQTLLADQGSEARTFLHGRGLSDISMQGLGWNAEEKYKDREAWGLPLERRRDGRRKSLWLPAGLVIPSFESQKVVRLRIRRGDPGNGPRYVIVSGSSMTPLTWGLGMKVLSVIESELDGFLIWQEAGDLSGVIALGSVTTRPDRITHEALTRASVILVCLDYDEAGARESWHFWPNTYREKVKRWPVPFGKDPSEAWQLGLDIRSWILTGISHNDVK